MDQFLAAHAAIERVTQVPEGTCDMVLNSIVIGAHAHGDAARLLDAYRATLRRSTVDAIRADGGGDEVLTERLRTLKTVLGRATIDVLHEAVVQISAVDVRATLARCVGAGRCRRGCTCRQAGGSPSSPGGTRMGDLDAARRSLGPRLVLADPDFGARAIDAPPSAAPRGAFEHQTALARHPYRSWLRGSRLPRLPHSRAEAELIRGTWPEARVLLGRDATVRALVEALRPRALHVAAHGFLYPGGDETHPLLRPGLALTVARTVSRDPDAAVGAAFVPALALMRLDVDGTELVVFLACSTSRGDLHPGGGVVGIAQALLMAGARCVVATPSRIPDDAANAVIRGFYAGLNQGATPEMARRVVRGANSGNCRSVGLRSYPRFVMRVSASGWGCPGWTPAAFLARAGGLSWGVHVPRS